MRVSVYVDGFNLFYGLRDAGWRQLYWYCPGALAGVLVRPPEILVCCKYFTARITQPGDKQRRQATYLAAIRERGAAQIIPGRIQLARKRCLNCGQPSETPTEKMTDVNLALELVCDAVEDRFDRAIVISGDSDLVPALRALARMAPEKTVSCAFPPNRVSDALRDASTNSSTLTWESLRAAQMPTRINRAMGRPLLKPPEWV